MLDDGTVRLGSQVRTQDGDFVEDWTIVACHEADVSRQQISEDCPFARALLGHQAGDQVRVQSPEGRRSVTILHVG
jgi:transcription elongation GreA/GreB family factor